MTEINAYDKPAFHWEADSNAPDVTSGVATFTYKQFNSGEIVTLQLRFESFATAHTISRLLDVAHEAGYEKGFAECKATVLVILGAQA